MEYADYVWSSNLGPTSECLELGFQWVSRIWYMTSTEWFIWSSRQRVYKPTLGLLAMDARRRICPIS